MKKTYQNPITKIVKIQTVQMIAQSVAGFNRNLNSDGDNDGGNALGRRSRSLWDDDEE